MSARQQSKAPFGPATPAVSSPGDFHGVYPPSMDAARALITALLAHNRAAAEAAPVTERQAQFLANLDYQRHPVFLGRFRGVHPASKRQASELIDAILAHNGLATDRQRALLQRVGVEAPEGLTKAEASELIRRHVYHDSERPRVEA